MLALHKMNPKINWVAPKAPAKNATNVTYKKKKKAKDKKKPVVSKSFKQAYHQLTPSKEIRYEFNEAMDTATSVASRVAWTVLDNVTQGTQLNQRLQSNIHLSYVHLSATLQANTNIKSKMVRIMLLREVNNGDINTTTFASLWKGTGSVSVYAPTGTSSDMRWPVNREIAQPIFDKTRMLHTEHDGILKLNYKIRVNKIVRYPVNTTSSAPYHGRLILLLCLADCDNTTTSSTVDLSAGVRVFFKDFYKGR